MNMPIKLEKLLAIIIIAIALILIPLKIISIGYKPLDDACRHVAFSMGNRNWSDILVITPGLESDHNAGWHTLLRVVQRCLNFDKEQLLNFSIIFLFLLFNLTGAITSRNCAAWFVTMLIIFIIQIDFFSRLVCGRPFIISCSAALILFKIWFTEPKEKSDNPSKFIIYLISFIALTVSVWLHGTWYNFLLIPITLFLSGKPLKALELIVLIAISTLAGAYLTGDFHEFLYFHYQATLNILSEKIYNWQLVTEFAEGNVYYAWLFPIVIIISLLHKMNKLKLNELSRDSVFIFILLSWLLSLRVTRFWFDWGLIAVCYWLSGKISVLISEMESVKKPFIRYFLFLFLIAASIVIIPQANWDKRAEHKSNIADFSKQELADFIPEEGGIVYNDSMSEFYFNYYTYPEAKYRYILGFEPAIMPQEDKVVFRDIVFTNYHYSAYKPWIAKLTPKDRIYTKVNISDYYKELDWIKASSKLWIGKLKNRNG